MQDAVFQYFRLFAPKRVTNLLVQTRLFQEFVGGEILGLRSVVHHLVMRIGVGVFLSEEVEILLGAFNVVRTERERTILDLGGIAPIPVSYTHLTLPTT